MRRRFLAATAVLLYSLIPAAAAGKPDIVLILLDDARVDEMMTMSKTLREIADKGVVLDRYYNTTAVCAPSRASILRGQYSHNTGVFGNHTDDDDRSIGDFRKLEKTTLPTVLRAAGYRTAILGKYLNGYGRDVPFYKPPGWDQVWIESKSGPNRYYDYKAYDGATVTTFTSRDHKGYMTDQIGQRAAKIIRDTRPSMPLFLYLALPAPHSDATPADRHLKSAVPGFVPRPNYDEADVSDKSAWTKRWMMSPLSPAEALDIRTRARKIRQTLLSADDVVAKVVYSLAAAGRLDNAWIFVTTDNGYMAGEHRIDKGKKLPYEEAHRALLLVRGPGVAPGTRSDELAGNIDLLSTAAAIAGVPPPDFVDGRSLLPALLGGTLSRQSLALEALEIRTAPNGGNYRGWVSKQGMFNKMLPTGEGEAYDLVNDPYQLENIWGVLPPSARLSALAQFEALAACRGATCRAVEDAVSPMIQR